MITDAQAHDELLDFVRRAVAYFDREAEGAPREESPEELYSVGKVCRMRLESMRDRSIEEDRDMSEQQFNYAAQHVRCCKCDNVAFVILGEGADVTPLCCTHAPKSEYNRLAAENAALKARCKVLDGWLDELLSEVKFTPDSNKFLGFTTDIGEKRDRIRAARKAME